MGHGAGLDRCGKSRPTGIRSPDRPASSSVTVLTELPGPCCRTVLLRFVSEFYGFIWREAHFLMRCDTEQFGLLVSEFDERPASIFRVDLEDGGSIFIRNLCSVFCQTVQRADGMIWPSYLVAQSVFPRQHYSTNALYSSTTDAT